MDKAAARTRTDVTCNAATDSISPAYTTTCCSFCGCGCRAGHLCGCLCRLVAINIARVQGTQARPDTRPLPQLPLATRALSRRSALRPCRRSTSSGMGHTSHRCPRRRCQAPHVCVPDLWLFGLAHTREPWSDFFAGDLKAVKAKAYSGEVAESPFRSICWKVRACPVICPQVVARSGV